VACRSVINFLWVLTLWAKAILVREFVTVLHAGFLFSQENSACGVVWSLVNEREGRKQTNELSLSTSQKRDQVRGHSNSSDLTKPLKTDLNKTLHGFVRQGSVQGSESNSPLRPVYLLVHWRLDIFRTTEVLKSVRKWRQYITLLKSSGNCESEGGCNP